MPPKNKRSAARKKSKALVPSEISEALSTWARRGLSPTGPDDEIALSVAKAALAFLGSHEYFDEGSFTRDEATAAALRRAWAAIRRVSPDERPQTDLLRRVAQAVEGTLASARPYAYERNGQTVRVPESPPDVGYLHRELSEIDARFDRVPPEAICAALEKPRRGRKGANGAATVAITVDVLALVDSHVTTEKVREATRPKRRA